LSADRNFDELFDRFSLKIKQSNKGRLRETLIREDLQSSIADLQSRSLKILDAGCGLGDMSIWFAHQGHQVMATDIASKMVSHTSSIVTNEGLSDRVQVYQRSVQDVLDGKERFDLICIHAVMEWLAQPYEILNAMPSCLNPGAYLSLTVYNLHRAVFSSLIRGNFERVLSREFGSNNPKSLTPPNPIEPEKILAILGNLGFTLELHAGLRCFYDYLSPQAQEHQSFDDLLILERRYRKQAPYRDIARYVHFIARWNG